jgi:DNA-binding response OmpR family regulator
MVVEDDLMIADSLEETLVEAGYTVCGIACTVAQAVKLGNAHCPDLAILDLRLAEGGLGTDIVPLLTDCNRIGILYATGNDNIPLTQADGDVCLRKPYLPRDVLGALQMVQQIVAGKAVSLPVPTGARVLL